jgi:DNA-binding NarL/FixJ family response regulator
VVIPVYIVEDHRVMRETLVEYLGLIPDIEVIGAAASIEEASAALPHIGHAVVLLDLSLAGRNGFELLDEIRRDRAFPCIILSGHGESMHVRRALAAGASGYVLKGDAAEVPVAVRAVADGRMFVSASLRYPVSSGT